MAVFEGGCLCGAVRYRAIGEGSHRTLCHCRSCRRATGAPVVAWATFPARQFEWISGEPKRLQSSPYVVRTFCPSCGSSLTYQREVSEVDVTICTLDHPELLPPEDHTWISEKLSWVGIDDGRPRFHRMRDTI
jgi:hypothetical protein